VAASAWLGRQTRDHVDVDIAVFHHDQAAVFAHPSPTAHHTDFEFEFLLNEVTDHLWILNRDRDIAVALDQVVRTSPWGLPRAAPALIQGRGNRSAADTRTVRTFRPRDEEDFFALLPTLTAGQRSWLRESLRRADPDHPWSAHLAS
jgi:hypothetical protein